MSSIQITEHKALIERVIRRASSQKVEIYMPLDSDAWCASHGVPRVRYATALKGTSTDSWGIVFAPSISEAESNSIISGMEFRGFFEARKLLDTPEKFVAHLALHELAHLENGWGQELEDECDQWAFERLDDAL